jgi:hypothetical protein
LADVVVAGRLPLPRAEPLLVARDSRWASAAATSGEETADAEEKTRAERGRVRLLEM